MRNSISLLGGVFLIGLLASGCAGPEKKFGRGMNNVYELVRGGEMRRSVEQTALFDSSDAAYTTGVIQGFNRSMARVGVGLYEVVTAPIPPYDPVNKNYQRSVYPDNYRPRLMEDSAFSTDTYIGYTGGDILPFIPGSRFHIFDN